MHDFDFHETVSSPQQCLHLSSSNVHDRYATSPLTGNFTLHQVISTINEFTLQKWVPLLSPLPILVLYKEVFFLKKRFLSVLEPQSFFHQSICAHTTWCLANAVPSVMQYLGRETITACMNVMLK